MLEYGLNCPCHGVQRFSSREARDKAAITYQCRPEWFRVGDDTPPVHTAISELYVGMYD